MKLLELWQGWAKHRDLEPHHQGPITEPPAAFVTDVLTLIRSEQERGRRMNVETEQLESRDFWCEWGALFAWARRHSSGHGISELFTGMINRTGPHENSSLFCDPASINDLPWGAHRDAFLEKFHGHDG